MSALRQKLEAAAQTARAEQQSAAAAGRIRDLEREKKLLLALLKQADQRLETALAIKTADAGATIRIRPRRKGNESTAVAVFSDWHVEETVDPKTVNGVNRYDLKVAEARIDAIFANVLTLLELSRHGTHIDQLVVALLGDLMTGYIHEELIEGNSLSPVETILWLKQQIGPRLRSLIDAAKCRRVIIPCTVGNHGRTTKKPTVATRTKNSYEWLLYHSLASEVPEAEWIIADGAHVYLDVYGQTLRFHHGDDLQYQGGVGGITIPVLKALPNWNTIRRADLDVFGHWHQHLPHRRFVCNASLIGHNAYAIRIKAPYEPPSQTFFLLEKDRGRTITTPIFAD